MTSILGSSKVGLGLAETQYSIRVVKEFSFRGAARRYSNRYHFDGSAVGDSTAMNTFMDGVVLAEKAIHPVSATIVECNVYAPGSDVAIGTKTYATVGTLVITGGSQAPGECAVIVRLATTKKSSKNHPVFCFSYYHQAFFNTASGLADTLLASQKTANEAYADSWKNGLSIGGRTYVRTTPDGHLTTGRLVSGFIGHRDFPR